MPVKLSIISSFYNAEAHIDRFLTMLRLQMLEEIEIILVDDCSTDGSLAIAHAHAQQDPRIHIFSNNHNMGPGASRNIGIGYTTGHYLAFADADDWMDIEFYQGLYETAQQNEFPDIVKGRFESDGPWGRLEAEHSLNETIRTTTAEGAPLYRYFTWQHWTAIYHHRLFTERNVRYGTTYISEDMTFLLRASHAAESFVLSDAPGLYHYLERPRSLAKTYTPKRYTSDMQAFKEQVDYLLECVEPNRWTDGYIGEIIKRYLWIINRIKTPGFACKRYHPEELREQLKRLSEKHYLGKPSPIIEALLADEPRAHMLPNNPLFSIIVPVRNMENTIVRALDSILRQDFSSYELLVVINDSSDGTAALVHNLTAHYPQIRITETDTPGLSHARNLGMQQAKGRYLMFLDGDDFYLPGALNLVAHAIEETCADVIVSTSEFCHVPEVFLNQKPTISRLQPQALVEYLDCNQRTAAQMDPSLQDVEILVRGTWSKVYRTSFLREQDITCDEDIVAIEDYLFNRRVFAHAQTAALIERNLYYYAKEEKQHTPTTIAQLEAIDETLSKVTIAPEAYGLTTHAARLMAEQIALLAVIKTACLDGGEASMQWLATYLQNQRIQELIRRQMDINAQPLTKVFRDKLELFEDILQQSTAPQASIMKH